MSYNDDEVLGKKDCPSKRPSMRTFRRAIVSTLQACVQIREVKLGLCTILGEGMPSNKPETGDCCSIWIPNPNPESFFGVFFTRIGFGTEG